MIKPKRSAEQQIADEADRKALNPLTAKPSLNSRKTTSALERLPTTICCASY